MRAAIIFITGLFCLSVFGDIELRYFQKGKDAIVEYGTVYISDDNKQRKEEVVYAWCGEVADTCDRENSKAVIRKRLDRKTYFERQALALGVRKAYLLRKDGKKLLEKNLAAAKEANNYDAIISLQRQKTQLNKVFDFVPFLTDVDRSIDQGKEEFARLVLPLEPEKRVDVEEKKKSHVEMATNTEWFLGSAKKVGPNEAYIICSKAKAAVPSRFSVESVRHWIHQSPIADWVTDFWTGRPQVSSKYRAAKRYLGPNTYENITMQDISVTASYAKFPGKEKRVELSSRGGVVASIDTTNYRREVKLENYKNQFSGGLASVLCVRSAN